MEKYRVTLTEEERQKLEDISKKGKTEAARITRARILLLADKGEHGPGWTSRMISEAVGVTPRTIEHVKQRFVERGIDQALERSPWKTSKPRLFDGEKEARLIALACSEPPEGRARWTLVLLSEKVVELEIVPHCTPESVRKVLKKTSCSLT